jgi:bifunctional non-homologous end joining protein LigD
MTARWSSPMLATLSGRPFSSPDWVYERKLDGVRAIGVRAGRSAQLYSRSRQRLDRTYPEIVDGLRRQPATDFAVDGEVVAFDGAVTSFARLQGRMQVTDPAQARRSGIPVFYYLFDVLHASGRDVTQLPLRKRKAVLRQLVDFGDPLRFSSHRNTDGERFYEEACRKGWEGLIAKRADSRYVHTRSTAWLKLKCSQRQEFVIGGYTDPQGARHGFGALLVGYYEDGRLRYAGKIGTGFDARALRDLSRRFRRLEQAEQPFAGRVPAGGVHWVRPELVCEAAFTEWTRDGRLRHPRFLGLRRDKRPRDVVRERPA